MQLMKILFLYIKLFSGCPAGGAHVLVSFYVRLQYRSHSVLVCLESKTNELDVIIMWSCL